MKWLRRLFRRKPDTMIHVGGVDWDRFPGQGTRHAPSVLVAIDPADPGGIVVLQYDRGKHTWQQVDDLGYVRNSDD